MKHLLSVLFICLFAITTQAQTPFALNASSNSKGLNEVILEVYPTDQFKANFGYTTSNSIGSYILVGTGYKIEVLDRIDIFGINKFIDLNANGIMGETHNQPTASGDQVEVGIDTSAGVALQYRFLTIGTSYHYLFGIDNHYWSPVNLGVRF